MRPQPLRFGYALPWLVYLYSILTDCSTVTLLTLRAEFGHTLQDLQARTKYSRFHGYEVMREFFEGNGMTLENWCFRKDEVKAMSCHYTRVYPADESAWLEDYPGRD